MSDNQTVTEREAVVRERKAFGLGWRMQRENGGSLREGEGLADRLYPLPSITRPRVVKDPEAKDYEWRFHDGRMQVRRGKNAFDGGGEWVCPCNWQPTAERVRLWADLLQNPTEEVTE